MATVNRGQLRERVLNRLDRNSEFFGDTEIHGAIDDSIRAINLYTGFIQQSTTHTNFTVVGQHVYSVPSGYLFLTRLEFDGRVLDKVPLRKLSEAYPDWLRETAANTGIPVSRWAPVGLTRFALHPAPSVVNLTIKLSGIVDHTPLAADTSTITIPDEFSSMIEDLASGYLQLKVGGQTFRQASVLYESFLRKMKELHRYKTLKMPAYRAEVEVSP